MLVLTLIAIILYFLTPLIVIIWLREKGVLNFPGEYLYGIILLELVFFIQILHWMGEI